MNLELSYEVQEAAGRGGGAAVWRDHHTVTEREAEEIILLSDPVQRNLRITQAYHDLKIGMTALIGDRNVSWCAFACWASRTAGRFIRGDYVPGIVQSYTERLELFHRGAHLLHRMLTGIGPDRPLPQSLLAQAIERVTQVVTVNVGWGNHLVFEDLGPLYARMLHEFRGATTYDPRAIDRFTSSLQPGPIEEGGQDLLIAAFRNYYKAMFTDSAKQRAELVLLANNQIGYHEQTRLQEPIVNSLRAPIAEIILLVAKERAHELTSRRLHVAVDRVLDRALRPLASWLQREWAEVSTRFLMRLELPLVTLSLGADLPYRCDHLMFPPELMSIEDPELRALLDKLDRTPDTTQGSAARNWGVLADRMNFVVDFFRTRQQDHSLYRRPFTEEQTVVIRAGGVPGGDL